MNKNWFNVNQYNVLKTFVKGETIEFKVENKPRLATFIHVSHKGILTIADKNGNEITDYKISDSEGNEQNKTITF
jgi:hypothetical protein